MVYTLAKLTFFLQTRPLKALTRSMHISYIKFPADETPLQAIYGKKGRKNCCEKSEDSVFSTRIPYMA